MTVVGIDFGTTTCSVAWWNGTVKEKPILQALDREEKGIAAAIMPTVVKLPNGRGLRNFKPVTDQMGRGEISLVRLETPKEKIKFKNKIEISWKSKDKKIIMMDEIAGYLHEIISDRD